MVGETGDNPAPEVRQKPDMFWQGYGDVVTEKLLTQSRPLVCRDFYRAQSKLSGLA